MTDWRLVVDVGGTNVRFARALKGGRLVDRVEYRVAAYPSFDDALCAYLQRIVTQVPCGSAAIAAAGPVADDEIVLTNLPWRIMREAVSDALGGVSVTLFNDLQAAALSIPNLDDRSLITCISGDGGRDPSAIRLAVNVGTGFGAATLMRIGERWASLPSEPGYMTLAAATVEEFALLSCAGGPLNSVEDAISGPGLMRLYSHFSAADGNAPPGHSDPRHIFERAQTDLAARRTLQVFTAFLARICGDLVLATAAWGGVYLFGSVARGWHTYGDLSLFRGTFVAKEKMASRMVAVPVNLVIDVEAPLVGLGSAESPGRFV